MNRVIDTDTSLLKADEWDVYIRDLKDYLRNADDPNEIATNGRSLLNIALPWASNSEGQDIVIGLLRRGADPNYPLGFLNFSMALTICNSVELVNAMLAAGLRVNDVFRSADADFVDDKDRFTILDYATGIANYLGRKKKPLTRLASKTGTSLGGRYRFIDETINLLRQAGARTATELAADE